MEAEAGLCDNASSAGIFVGELVADEVVGIDIGKLGDVRPVALYM